MSTPDQSQDENLQCIRQRMRKERKEFGEPHFRSPPVKIAKGEMLLEALRSGKFGLRTKADFAAFENLTRIDEGDKKRRVIIKLQRALGADLNFTGDFVDGDTAENIARRYEQQVEGDNDLYMKRSLLLEDSPDYVSAIDTTPEQFPFQETLRQAVIGALDWMRELR